MAAQTDDPGYRFARSLALAGPRPAGSAAERRAHARVAARFRNAGLRLGTDTFAVPGHGRSRNVVGVFDTPSDCLVVVMAHTDSVPPAPGADDNASGVGTLVALAPRLKVVKPACDVWLIATGAEERPYTGRPDHLGALAAGAPRPPPRPGGRPALRALARRGRPRAHDAPALAGRGAAGRRGATRSWRPRAAPGLRVRWLRDSGTGNSDHREFALAGLPAAKLGVPDEPCRHTACDTVAPPAGGHVPARSQAGRAAAQPDA